MKVTPEMKVRDALAINDRMLDAFTWVAPEFERLRNPYLREIMSKRVSISQAARIAKIPLTEALFLLNLAAGEEMDRLTDELNLRPADEFELAETNPPKKPSEVFNISDDDPRIHYVDVTAEAENFKDPLPRIVRGLIALINDEDILLVRHPFDPIPLRDLLGRQKKLASWAEERRPHDWYIYFYHPAAGAEAIAHPPVSNEAYVKAAA